jgi:hypothetical protein
VETGLIVILVTMAAIIVAVVAAAVTLRDVARKLLAAIARFVGGRSR